MAQKQSDIKVLLSTNLFLVECYQCQKVKAKYSILTPSFLTAVASSDMLLGNGGKNEQRGKYNRNLSKTMYKIKPNKTFVELVSNFKLLFRQTDNNKQKRTHAFKNSQTGASLVAQWLRICLPMQEIGRAHV